MIVINVAVVAMIGSILSVIIAVFTLVTMWTTYIRRVRAEAERTGQLELKVDTMWELMFKSSQVHARQRGVLRSASPDRVDPQIRAQFDSSGLGAKVLHYYANTAFKDGRKLKDLVDSEIGLIFARSFGDDLITDICMPLASEHITLGDALVAAVQLCREEEQAHGR
jgi:hypothetical protein